VKTLLINETENPEELNMMLGFDLGLREYQVRAIFPSLEYALMVLKKSPGEFKFIVIEPHKEMLIKKFAMINTLSKNFPGIPILIIGESRFTRSNLLNNKLNNLHHFETLEGAARFIAIHPNSKE